MTHNATTFTSEEFKTFVKQNGILHTSAPGHPAERYIQTFKASMKNTGEHYHKHERQAVPLLVAVLDNP